MARKILLINGSPHENGCTATALREVEGALNAGGIDTELRWLGMKPIAGCIACGKCYESGRCVFGDQVNEILEGLDSLGGVVVGSPVYYAGPAGQLCAFLDRLFYSSSGRWAGKLGASVVSCRRGGAATAFDRLNKYFGINSMHVVGSQYWNQVHGNTPEEVLRDEEGMQTMRTLGRNMAWLLAGVEAGERAGLRLPEPEPRARTNFIR